MKKIIAFATCFVTLIFAVACGKTDGKIKITVVDGAPALAVATLLESENYEVKIVSGAEKVLADVTNKECDFAVLPLNSSATLYNRGLDIKLLSVNVFGVLHLVGKDESVKTFEDLKNKTVYNIGKGATPDITLQYILRENGVEFTENENDKNGKVLLKYVQSATELIPLLKQGVADFGVLGEPAVTNAVKMVSGLTSLFDLTVEFDNVSECKYTQAGIVVSGEFLKKNKKSVQNFYNDLNSNDEYLKNNYESLKEKLQSKGSTLNVDFNLELIEKLNLKNELAYGIKTDVLGYLNLIYRFNSDLVGGKIPNEEFFARI